MSPHASTLHKLLLKQPGHCGNDLTNAQGCTPSNQQASVGASATDVELHEQCIQHAGGTTAHEKQL
jgi:hypothetical protein